MITDVKAAAGRQLFVAYNDSAPATKGAERPELPGSLSSYRYIQA